MSLSRRDFMSVFGISIASLLARCKWEDQLEPPPTGTPFTSCYLPTVPGPTGTPPMNTLSARERLRLCWLSFTKLAQETGKSSAEGNGGASSSLQDLTDRHRLALEELVDSGVISRSVADLVQEAYAAALNHVWRSNALITCYITAGPVYVRESAETLIRQVETLDQISSLGGLDPVTSAKARQALEHDLAFYSLSEGDLRALYSELGSGGHSYPPFEEVELDISPDARAAAKFIIRLLIQP